MSGPGLARKAVSNSFASMSRTVLTVVAIFIGAFTLTLTTAVGNGINSFIDDTTSAIGNSSTLTVTKTPVDGDGPVKYDADTTIASSSDPGPDGGTVETLNEDDLKDLRDVEGVVTAEPVVALTPDYVVYEDGRPYRFQAAGYVEGTNLQLVAGAQPDPESKTRQIAIPESYVDPLEFDDAADAIDETVTIGVTDDDGESTKVTATVVAVVQSTLAGGDVASTNDALTRKLYDSQSVGLSTKDKETYASATVEVDSADTTADVDALKTTLSDEGYTAETVDDQIGDFKGVIDAIVLVLNGFAIIALLAAGFGIVNTLLMSVKERTREIGLMKAMGMGGGSIFTMFSLEAVFIGFLGSVVGVGAAVVVGTVVNGIAAGGILANLPGLTLIAFTPATIISIMALVIGIAFLAGSIPAWKAARQDPIESLRYE